MLKNCLLIDDDQDDQELFLMALERVDSQIKCSVANNGVEGLAALSDHFYTPTHIFLDINMPKMNGIECLQRIRINRALGLGYPFVSELWKTMTAIFQQPAIQVKGQLFMFIFLCETEAPRAITPT